MLPCTKQFNKKRKNKAVSMKYARELLEKEAGKLAKKAFGEETLQETRDASKGILCSTAPFKKAAEKKMPPAEIASQAAKKISSLKKTLVAEATADNGYVNFAATNEYFSLAVTQACAMKKKFGCNKGGKKKVFIIDYSDPNVGKPFHVGHIRSTILGHSIVALKKACGYEAHGYAYLGDAGTQVAKLVVALDEFTEMKQAKTEKQLLKYYQKIHDESEKNPALEEKARNVLQKIEEGDAEVLKKVEEIRNISINGFEKNWRKLGVKFDVVTGESAFISPAKKIVSECVEKQIAFVDKNGETVVELEKQGLPNTILMRSNGTTLYLTRDIAREDWASEKWKYDESLVITASEQNNHFKQFHKICELLQRPYAEKLSHVGFGLVFLESGKISSRKGNVVFLDDVLKEAVDSAKKEIEKRKNEYDEKEIKKIADFVGVGGTKFSFLRVGSEKSITFNPSLATSFEGDTGAYCQYTCVRAKNILRKAFGETKQKILVPENAVFNDSEKAVCQMVGDFPFVVQRACDNLQPHVLCDFALKLSARFSEFYEKCPVLNAENEQEKAKRLAITKAVEATLENCLRLLGITVPERM